MSIMSINVFKKHSGNKITFSDRSIFCGELKVVGFSFATANANLVVMLTRA